MANFMAAGRDWLHWRQPGRRGNPTSRILSHGMRIEDINQAESLHKQGQCLGVISCAAVLARLLELCGAAYLDGSADSVVVIRGGGGELCSGR